MRSLNYHIPSLGLICFINNKKQPRVSGKSFFNVTKYTFSSFLDHISNRPCTLEESLENHNYIIFINFNIYNSFDFSATLKFYAILATWEAEIRRISEALRPAQATKVRPYLKNT
jgi:hypothetical protein